MVSHWLFKPVRMAEISSLSLLARTSGATAAAIAIAPQARTEKTTEKRIVIERLRRRGWKGRAERS